MRTTLKDGYIAEFDDDGASLRVLAPNGVQAFSVAPPEFSAFYTFAEHAIYGNCPAVSFEPGHTRNGWPDWYLKVDVESKSVHLLNPWR
jgi:hypothetical protein